MKLLFDSCMSVAVVHELQSGGVDVVWVGHWPSDPGDAAILARARAEARVLITHDKDFGELAVLQQQPHAGIVRLVDVPLGEVGFTCRRVATFYARELAEGAIVTVEARRTRVASLTPKTTTIRIAPHALTARLAAREFSGE